MSQTENLRVNPLDLLVVPSAVGVRAGPNVFSELRPGVESES